MSDTPEEKSNVIGIFRKKGKKPNYSTDDKIFMALIKHGSHTGKANKERFADKIDIKPDDKEA